MKHPVRVTLIGAAVLVGAAVVGAAAMGFGASNSSRASGAADLPPATAPVTQLTMTQTQQVTGTLGYGVARPVTQQSAGTITWLPAVRTVVHRGQPMYKLDNHPVPLLYGDLPFYRQLSWGDAGPDVRELEHNLAALGYTGFTVDDTYTGLTAEAVSDWQQHLGLTETGTFQPASVVLASGAVRINSLSAQPGDHVPGPVLADTGTTRTVHIDLDVSLQQLVKEGTPAKITLPSGTVVEGSVSGIGSVVAGHGDAPATIGVTVDVSNQSALGSLDQAPVAVDLVSATARDVLTVPVTALVALAGGGYGVQVVSGSTAHFVSVQLGLFANGRVQVAGSGITVGTRVGVPA